MWAFIAGAAATAQTAATPLIGEYKGWMVDHGQISQDTQQYMSWSLVLKPDGTFLWRMIDHLMVNIDETATGSYRVNRGHVSLKGKATGTSDDGYKREPVPLEFIRDFGITNKQLKLEVGPDIAVIFARVGSTPEIPAGMRQITVVKDVKAIRLLNQTAEAYRRLRSYSDTGEVLKKQENYAPQTSHFTTYFVKPNQLRFSAQIVEAGKPVAKAELWVKGKKVRHFDSLDDYAGVQTEGSASMAIFDIGQTYGTDTEVVPNFFLGDGFPLGTARRIEMKGTAPVGQAKCWVVCVTDDRSSSTSYWIDCASYMVVKIRSHNIAGDEEISLRPRVNPHITAKQLAPSTPPGQG